MRWSGKKQAWSIRWSREVEGEAGVVVTGVRSKGEMGADFKQGVGERSFHEGRSKGH